MSEAEKHLARSRASLEAVQAMEAALGRGDTDMTPHFTPAFLWRGKSRLGDQAGAGGISPATGSARCGPRSPTGST